MKKFATVDLREDKDVKNEEGRVYIYKGLGGHLEFVAETGPWYKDGDFADGYVQVYNDWFKSFSGDYTYKEWLLDTAIDQLVEDEIIEFSGDNGCYYFK